MKKNTCGDFEDLNAKVRGIWDTIAQWWDDKIGDGNAFQCELIELATERLLKVAPGETLLDVGCGAGRFARRMAELGADVVAFDFSEQFVKRAKERTSADMENIEYHIIDATKREQIVSLGSNRFDGAVATMCLMDMTSIEPLISALRQILKPNGRFVFSIMHPCFQPPEVTKFIELFEADVHPAIKCGVKVSKYLTPTAWKSIGIIGQPEPQYYFHRPLSVLFNSCFDGGFVMDGIEEPAFEKKNDKDESTMWRDLPEIPPILAVRMRLAKK